MYFRPFTVKIGAEQRGFETGSPRPVIALRQTADGETELLLSTDEGDLSWVDREFAHVVEIEGLAVVEPPEPPGPPQPPVPRKPRKAGRRTDRLR